MVHDGDDETDGESPGEEAAGVEDAADGDSPETEEESGGPREEVKKAQEKLEAEADRAIEEFDQGVVDLLAWLLDTETRARIYVYLRQHPDSTSEEVADGTGLYPSTVREALAELHDEGTVTRGKRESAGAGNNPYEYEAIAPSDLVSGAIGQVQEQLNAVFSLDDRPGGDQGERSGPVTITVADEGSEEAETEVGSLEEDRGTASDGDDGDHDDADGDPDEE